MASTLQNLPEDFLYNKLPEGVINVDERGILRALIGGVQDRVEDIRSYVRKFEFFFESEPIVNTVVLVTFATAYGKVLTRSLDIQSDTPTEEGDQLTAWAIDQLGIDSSQVTSCVFGEDLFRYVDANTLQYLAASIGAVLYSTAAQSGTSALNEQKILNSYFPRLKIKGTAMSFDILGKLIGFDDVRMTPLWGRLSPRAPNDIGAAVNDQDFAQSPAYFPQQDIGVAYNPHDFRDGPYYAWVGTASSDPASTYFYSQSVNGFQPWVKVSVTGSVVHPAIGDSIALEGGSPHTKATASAGQGLQFQALGEGGAFNGLQITFQDWNSGSDRLVSITDRLSTIKYRTSYYDLALTLTDEHAIAQFGTTTVRPNKDLQANSSLVPGRPAVSPFRPWRRGTGDSHLEYHDFNWVSSGTVSPLLARTQAPSSTFQLKTDDIQAAGQESAQIMEEVRAATRFPRRTSVGMLNQDDAYYAGVIASHPLFTLSGSSSPAGYAHTHPAPGYTLSATASNSASLKIRWATEAGKRYGVYFANTLVSPIWYQISQDYIGDGAEAVYYATIGIGTGYFLVIDQDTRVEISTSSSVASASTVLQAEYDPFSNGTVVNLSDGALLNGSYDLSSHYYQFSLASGTQSFAANGLVVSAVWTPLDTEVVRGDPTPLPGSQVFAVVGATHTCVQTNWTGTLVSSWNPDHVLMLGDHTGTFATEDYSAANAPFVPMVNAGKVTAAIGNDDGAFGAAPFYVFFKQDKRYFDRVIGNVHVFVVNSSYNSSGDETEPDGITVDSKQALWLREAMSASQAPWKIVLVHHNPYYSDSSFPLVSALHDVLQWPYKDWGADLVLMGHVHAYEHLYVTDASAYNNGIHMVAAGMGGLTPVQFLSSGTSSYSVLRAPITPAATVTGAVRLDVTSTSLVVSAYKVDGSLIETFSLTNTASAKTYQNTPEDEPSVEGPYEVFDAYPWRNDIVGGGELVEINNEYPTLVDDLLRASVANTVSVNDQSGAAYSVYGLKSTVEPPRMVAQVNSTDSTYSPGQLAIAYRGDVNDLSAIPPKRHDIVPGLFTDLEVYGTNSFKVYHAGLVNGLLVADPASFNGPHHRDGLKMWLPMSEHPDEGAVVNDLSVSGVETELTGFVLAGSFSSRLWDDGIGWSLYVKNSGLVGSGIREVGANGGDYALSLWVNPDPATGYFTQTLFSQGPLAIDLHGYNDVLEVRYGRVDGSGVTIGTIAVSPGTFSNIALSISDGTISYGVGDRATPLTMQSASLQAATYPIDYQPFNEDHSSYVVSCPTRGIQLSDVRAWNKSKTKAELDKVRDYQPVPTICTYWPANIEVSGSGERYGMYALDNGFITLSELPPAVRLNQLARVFRYDYEGRYDGENRFNEVGLGGGTLLPPTWRLGQQFYEMTSTGTVVVSTSIGQVPYNPLWQLPGDGQYLGLNFAGSTATGIPATGTAFPSSPWPPAMESNNPVKEFVWITGDDSRVYEAHLKSVGAAAVMEGSLVARTRTDSELALNGALRVVTATETTPYGSWAVTGTAWATFSNGSNGVFNPAQVLVVTEGTHIVTTVPQNNGVSVLTDNTGEVKVYHPAQFVTSDLPTGAVSILQSGGYELTCTRGGAVYQRTTTGTLNTPPLYMYLTSRVFEDTSTGVSAYNRWNDNGDLTVYGNTLAPPQAAVNENSFLEFANSSTLAPGRYRLTIESGCIGQVDNDFDGFSVIISVDTVQLERRLQAGQSGADFRGIDTFEFDYTGSASGIWLITIQYLNALADTARGTARNLVIYNYKLEGISTRLYKISLAPSGSSPVIDQVATSGNDLDVVPGGWLAILNSYGTVVRYVHESNVVPFNDTMTSNVPLSSVLTGSTWMRREDHPSFVSSQTVLPDSAPLGMPVFSGVIVR